MQPTNKLFLVINTKAAIVISVAALHLFKKYLDTLL